MGDAAPHRSRHSDDLTDAERAAIDRANEEARRRRSEAYAAMAPATGEYERPPAPKQSAMILLENVTKIYPGNVTGLKDVSLQIDKGEWVFLVGASGSGKSTMIKLLLKEIDATRGNVIVGGRSLSKLRRSRIPQLRRNIGCVFQDFKLLPNRTVFDNVAYALEVQGQRRNEIERKVPEILHLVGLGEKMEKFPNELSGGQAQRVSIARAFVNHPPLLICDEPTGNLDPDTSIGIMQLLYRIQRTGTTVLMATHDREMVDKMRRRVVALEDAPHRARRPPRRLHLRGRPMTHGRMGWFFGEALKSLRSNFSTTLAAVVTVLIVLYLFGIGAALGSYIFSYTEKVRSDVTIKVWVSDDAKDSQRTAIQRAPRGRPAHRRRPASSSSRRTQALRRGQARSSRRNHQVPRRQPVPGPLRGEGEESRPERRDRRRPSRA